MILDNAENHILSSKLETRAGMSRKFLDWSLDALGIDGVDMGKNLAYKAYAFEVFFFQSEMFESYGFEVTPKCSRFGEGVDEKSFKK